MNGAGTQRLDAGHAVNCVLDWLRDKHLDLLRRKPRRFGLDDHQWRRELREDIVFRARQRVEPIAHQHAGKRDDDAAEPKGKTNDSS